jgi:hypothetical protein
VLLSVRRSNASGTLGVHFAGLNFNGVPIETFEFFDLDPLLTAIPSADQIGLSITHDIGTNEVNGSFSLFSGGSLLLTQGLDNVVNTGGFNAQLYSDEAFTRTALYTIKNAETQVSEPGMVAVLGAGVVASPSYVAVETNRYSSYTNRTATFGSPFSFVRQRATMPITKRG